MRGFGISASALAFLITASLFADDKSDESPESTGCRSAILRFQAMPKRMIVTNQINEEIHEIAGIDTKTSYKTDWKVRQIDEGVEFRFEFMGQSRIPVVVTYPVTGGETYVLSHNLPRGESKMLKDLNLLTAVLRHMSDHSVSGEKVVWEVDDPNLVELFNTRLQKIGEDPALDLSADLRRGTGAVEDDPMFYSALQWDPLRDAYFPGTRIEDGEAAIKRVNESETAQIALSEELKDSEVGKAIGASGPWGIQVQLVPVDAYLLPLAKREQMGSDDYPPLFAFRYQIILEAL